MQKKNLNIAIATISDSRTLANDRSGDILENRIKEDNHNCFSRNIIKDDMKKIEKYMQKHTKYMQIHIKACKNV